MNRRPRYMYTGYLAVKGLFLLAFVPFVEPKDATTLLYMIAISWFVGLPIMGLAESHLDV